MDFRVVRKYLVLSVEKQSWPDLTKKPAVGNVQIFTELELNTKLVDQMTKLKKLDI